MYIYLYSHTLNVRAQSAFQMLAAVLWEILIWARFSLEKDAPRLKMSRKRLPLLCALCRARCAHSAIIWQEQTFGCKMRAAAVLISPLEKSPAGI
jgi:hypothetical protein